METINGAFFLRHSCLKKVLVEIEYNTITPWEKYLVTLLGAGLTQNVSYTQQCNSCERGR